MVLRAVDVHPHLGHCCFVLLHQLIHVLLVFLQAVLHLILLPLQPAQLLFQLGGKNITTAPRTSPCPAEPPGKGSQHRQGSPHGHVPL